MKKIQTEGFKDNKTPDLKYYAFDWDDNIVSMPTEIILKTVDDEEVGMSTKDYAEYRNIIGKKIFSYDGHQIQGYSDNPFRNFKVEGDKKFISDSLRATPGPAFDDFREAINNGSIFAIITARGHTPNVLKQAVYNYIITGFNGIDKDQLLKNLRKYRTFVDEEDMSDTELIKSYLELNRYNPVSFGDDKNAVNPEEAKVKAMEDFVSYIKAMAALLNKKIYIKQDISNKFVPKIPQIGFSDDDLRNVELMKKHFKGKHGDIVKTYSTAGGVKKKY